MTLLASIVRASVPSLLPWGNSHRGYCPWCQPANDGGMSLYVYADMYHCFGCGAHGDAIAFVMQSDGTDFRTAVGKIADWKDTTNGN